MRDETLQDLICSIRIQLELGLEAYDEYKKDSENYDEYKKYGEMYFDTDYYYQGVMENIEKAYKKSKEAEKKVEKIYDFNNKNLY